MTTTLDTRSQDTIVGTIAAGMQSRLGVFLNFAVGSVLLALAEAYSGVCLWLQECFTRILRLTRASTSDGEDLDSWVADYGLTRLAASPSSGLVTLSLYSPKTSATVVPVGAQVKSFDGSLVFTVYADTTNASYSADAGGYTILAGATQISVPVVCNTPGTVGNVAENAISLIASQMPADTIANPSAFTNGLDAESDPDLRSRFVDFLGSLSQGTEAAYRYAIRTVQQGLRIQYVSTPGLVQIWVDDGSGNPPPALLAACAVAVDAARAGGVQAAVFGASRLLANVSMIVTVDTASGYKPNDVVAAIDAALAVAINSLPEGATLAYSRLGAIAWATSPGVTNVTSVLLNGGTSDLVPAIGQTIKAGNVQTNPAS